jgi:hypothetical protein
LLWTEKDDELRSLALDLSFDLGDDDKLDKSEYGKATEGLKFAEVPVVMKTVLVYGSAVKGVASSREMFSCHPETWEGFSEELKAQYEPREQPKYQFLSKPIESFPSFETKGPEESFVGADGVDRSSILNDVDDDGEVVRAGDHITFAYGIPPVHVVARIESINRVLYAMTPEHNPKRCRLSKLRECVGAWWKHLP